MVDRSKSQLKKKKGNLMWLVGIISHAKKGKASKEVLLGVKGEWK